MGLLISKIKCGNAFFTHYYLCPYLPRIAGTDYLSHSLLKFKQRVQPDLDAWIDCSVQLLVALPLPADIIILRALRHDEMTARTDLPSALDLLGFALARHLGGRYLPSLLTKSHPTLPNKHLTRRQRAAQLDDVYHLAPLPDPAVPPSPDLANAPAAPSPYLPAASNPTPFLLIDDVLTTGTTMRTLIHTLRHSHPASSIKAFTLARADYRQTSPLTPETDPIAILKSRLFC